MLKATSFKGTKSAVAGLLLLLSLFLCANSALAAVTITRTSSEQFYADSNLLPAYNCNYVCYAIQDNATSYDSLWVTLTTSDATITLAPADPGRVNLGPVPAGTTKYAYFYLQSSSNTETTGHQHTITVFNGLPSLGLQLTAVPFTLAIKKSISAQANKVTSVVTGPNPPTLGGIVTITADGDTGTIGSGKTFAVTAGSLPSWAAGAYELYETVVTLTGAANNNNNGLVFSNQLFFTLPDTKDTHWQAVYKLRAVNVTTTPTDVTPIADINSGGQNMKYTVQATGILPMAIAENGLVMITDSVTCGGVSAVGTNVTYSLIVSNSAPNDAYFDSFNAILFGSVTNATYVNNSSKTNGVAYSNPTISSTPTNQTLTWSGYFLVPANSTRTLSFEAAIPTVYGTYTNHSYATIGTNQIDSTLILGDNSPASCSYTLAPLADIRTTKIGATNVNATSNLVYTLTITNLGPSASSNLVIIDQLPTNVTFVSASGGGFLTNGQVRWTNFVQFTNMQSTNLTVTVTAPNFSTTLTNVVSSTAAIEDPVAANNDGSSTNAIVITTVQALTDLEITKTGPTNVFAGTDFAYTIALTNLGPSVGSSISVTDALPAGLTFVSATGDGLLTNGVVIWSVPILTNATGTNFTLTVTAPAFGTTFTNIVSGGSIDLDSVPANNNGTATNAIVITTVIPHADVFTGKSGPTNLVAGTNFSYIISVTNMGPSTASNVVVNDLLPPGVAFISASDGGTNDNGTVTWPTLLSLTNTAFTNFTVTVSAPLEGGIITNIVSSTSSTEDPVPTNNNGTATSAIVISTVESIADVIAMKAGPTNVFAGTNFTYTITVTNAGPSTASNVVVSDLLPLGATFVDASDGGTNDSGTVTWPTILALTNSAFTNFTITITPPADGGTITNIISSTSTTTDPSPTNNNGSAEAAIVITAVTPHADVISAKTGPASVNAASQFSYTIAITNLGPSTASNLVVTDVLPQGVTFVSATGGATNDNGTVVWPVITAFTNLAVTNFTLTVTAPLEGGVLTNVVSSTSTTLDQAVTNNNGTASAAIVVTTVIPQADVETTKAGPASVRIGTNIVYTISVTNHGPSTASNIVVSDTLPTGVTFVSATLGGIENSGIVTWPTIVALTNGGATSFSITISPDADGSFTNVVQSTSPTLDPVPGNNDGSDDDARVITVVDATPRFNVTGKAYVDANLNAFWDTDEVGTGMALFVKIVDANTPAGPALQVVSADSVTGIYAFTNIEAGTYTLILDDNNSPSDLVPTIPSGWTGTETPTYIRQVLVNNVDVPNQNFGLAQAVTITGSVFKDTGVSGGNANDGIRNGAEPGIANVPVRLTDSSGSTVYATAITDGAGNFTLFIPNSVPNGAELKVVESNLGSYRSTGGNVGNTAGTYNRIADTIAFTRNAGMAYTGLEFGDVPENQFNNDGQQAGLPGSTVFYSHIFIAGTAGEVSFSTANTATPNQSGWTQLIYRDVNCNGQLDPAEPVLNNAIPVVPDEKICIIVKEFIPIGAPLNAQDQVIITADFSYTGASPTLNATYTRTDLTTVGTPLTAGLTLVKAVDKSTALPGEVITYVITYTNNGSDPLSDIVVHDNTPSYTVFVSATNGTLPNDLSGVTIANPALNATGTISWTFTGTLAPGAQGTVTFQVKVQ